jgi:hypothetical protein
MALILTLSLFQLAPKGAKRLLNSKLIELSLRSYISLRAFLRCSKVCFICASVVSRAIRYPVLRMSAPLAGGELKFKQLFFFYGQFICLNLEVFLIARYGFFLRF